MCSNTRSTTTGAKPTTAAAATAPAQAAAPSVPQGGRLTAAWNLEVNGLAPAQLLLSPELIIGRLMYEGLIEYDERTKKYAPGLAESWEISPDGKTWTFKLRQGVTFHDGAPFDARAAKTSLDWVNDPKSKASPLVKAYTEGYQGAEAVDDRTLRVSFSQPNGNFIVGLVAPQLGMLSPQAIQKYGEDVGKYPTGSGPYKFKELVPNDHVTLVRNPARTWGGGYSHAGPGYLDEITFRLIKEDATRSAALERGEADISYLSFADYPRFASDKSFQTIRFLRAGTPRAVHFNTERGPLADIEVRRAIGYAINRDGIAKAPFLGGAAEPAKTPLSPVVYGYDESLEKLALPFDPAKARATLDAAGWKLGASGVREKDGKPLNLTFRAVNLTFLGQVAQLVQAQLKDVGIGVDLQLAADWGTLLALTPSGDYDMVIGGSFQPGLAILNTNYDPRQLGKSSVIWSRFPSDQLASLLQKGAETVDPEKQAGYYQQAQQLIMENVIMVPLYIEPNTMAAKPQLDGLRPSMTGEPMFLDVYMKK